MLYDVVIVGGGPAGLSAALILARCLRTVLLCDAGQPRNIRSKHMHGYLTRDGICPSDFFQIAYDQLKIYDNVTVQCLEVKDAYKQDQGFQIHLADGSIHQSKKLLLATGLVDELPKLNGLQDLYGLSVFHCPYCDGWEVRNKALAVYGKGERGYKLALTMKIWSRDVILISDGESELNARQRRRLIRNGILIHEDEVESLRGENGFLKEIVFKTGQRLAREALFFNTGSYPKSHLAVKLGCHFTKDNGIRTGKYEATDVPGLYAAGNILRDVQMVIVAAAEGAKAAFGINAALNKESLIT